MLLCRRRAMNIRWRATCIRAAVHSYDITGAVDAVFARGATITITQRCRLATPEWSRVTRRCHWHRCRRRWQRRRFQMAHLGEPVTKRTGGCSWPFANLVTTPQSSAWIASVKPGGWKSGYVRVNIVGRDLRSRREKKSNIAVKCTIISMRGSRSVTLFSFIIRVWESCVN